MRPDRAGRICVWMALSCGLGAGPADAPWSFAPVRRPDAPAVPAHVQARNPIDAFAARPLAEHRLALAPEADRRTLVRRLTFDLTGLPPTPEEVEAFARDEAVDAYDRLVDRLLSSPHYGERWARHWLDLVRFAETHGYERDDPKPNAWRYRDWVVRAFNRDLPYDRFLIEQLAGDELPDAAADTRTATGMYQLGLIDDEPADTLMDRFDQLDDIVKTVGTTMLGLSVHCARCHDHKFDPITQVDYYRMLAFFTPSKRFVRDHADSISLMLATPEERARHEARNAAVDARTQPLTDQINALRTFHRDELLAERQRAGAAPTVKPEEIDVRFTADEKALRADLEQEIKVRDSERPAPLPTALGLTDVGPRADPTKLLMRGDAHRPGAEVAPGFLSAIDPDPPTIVPPPDGKTTGRRLALARWIARAENPLTARVFVNRLWQHHFGQGLVATPSDFGAVGEEPSNRALLDWLASEFVARGWSVKAMHRLMVTSAAYRQSGRWDQSADEADPTAALLWRYRPRRLEAEPIRDAVLSVSGALNHAVGGPSVTPPIDPVVLAGQSRPGSGWGKSEERADSRRSLYVYVKRTLPLPELEVLDAADNNDPCPRRSVTTTAPQALTLLNSAFLHEQSARFAARLAREAGDEPAAQVRRGFALAFARPPTAAEVADALDFLARQTDRIEQRALPKDRERPHNEALRAFCLVLFNANEFVTVD